MNDQTNLTSDEQAAAAAAASALAPKKEAGPKLTHDEKVAKRLAMLKARIETDTAEYNELANEVNNAEAMKNLAVGSVVQIKLGRKFADKDTTRIVEGTIVGEQVQEDGGKLFKIAHGEGFAADFAIVSPGGILAVGPIAVAE